MNNSDKNEGKKRPNAGLINKTAIKAIATGADGEINRPRAFLRHQNGGIKIRSNTHKSYSVTFVTLRFSGTMQDKVSPL